MKYFVNISLFLFVTLWMSLLTELSYRIYLHFTVSTLSRVLEDELPQISHPATLGEIIQPSKNQKIIYELRPEIQVEFLKKGVHVSINAEGFRGVQVPRKRTDALRILGLGDSVMFGLGVLDSETYLSRLQSLLEDEQSIEIINTAVPGYNTVMQVATLREKGLRYQPDLVIIDFVQNDLSLPNFVRKPIEVFSVRKLLFASLLQSMLARLQGVQAAVSPVHPGLVAASSPILTQQSLTEYIEQVPQEYRSMVGWSAYEGALDELAALADEHGFRVMLITLMPVRDPVIQRVMGLARERGFLTIDIGAEARRYLRAHAVDSYYGSELSLGPQEAHPSALYHDIAAQRLASEIRQSLPDRVLTDGRS